MDAHFFFLSSYNPGNIRFFFYYPGTWIQCGSILMSFIIYSLIHQAKLNAKYMPRLGSVAEHR